MMTRAAGLARTPDQAEAVLGRLNRLVGRQLPEFADTARRAAASPALDAAIGEAQRGISRRLASGPSGAAAVSTPVLLEELNQRKQALKQAAATPVERATIEIVALLFQSILTEERDPGRGARLVRAAADAGAARGGVRARFLRDRRPPGAAPDRPHGRVRDGLRRGSRAVGETLEKEIKRVVQVVEAYPDTGRRVFQTVLIEFEKFLEHYFRNENEASRKGVSLAQQVEQRETLAIQYTIELRKMLNEVPVQEGVREFLFHVWADVLATTAVKAGDEGDADARDEARRRRPDLVGQRQGLARGARRGHPPPAAAAEDAARRHGAGRRRRWPSRTSTSSALNNSLAAAFTAKAAAISQDRLEELMTRLETLEELLPDAEDVEIDESMVLDLSGHESSELEVVAEGGSMPTPAMLAWARELQVGSWYMLDYRDRNESVQLAWQGMRKPALAVRLAAGPRRAVPARTGWRRSCRPGCWCRRRTSR